MTLFLHRFPQRGDVSVGAGLLAIAVGAVYGHYMLHLSLLTSILSSLSFFAYHALTVVVATVLYRISPLHPLYKYPGPFINKVTSLKLAHMVYTGKRHLVIPALHERYGVHVRTGPNTLSINSYSAIAPIYASSTAYPKSNAYTPGRMHGDGLFFIQGIEEHNARRRLWAPAFQPNVCVHYPFRKLKRHSLISCLVLRGGRFSSKGVFGTYSRASSGAAMVFPTEPSISPTRSSTGRTMSWEISHTVAPHPWFVFQLKIPEH